jgi:acyl dehydratase
MAEATADFKRRLREAFEVVHVGQTFTFRRTFTEGDVALFCGVTGDYNPYHLDDAFVSESWFGRRILPGLLTASMATHLGGMIGFLATEMRFEFLEPVYIGDTVTCTFTIREKDEANRAVGGVVEYVNQRDTLVLRGEARGFPSDVRLAR